MTYAPKRWQLAPAAPPSHIAKFPHLSPITVQILYNRGITTAAKVAAFLSESCPAPGDEYSPFKLPDMPMAVSRLRRAIQEQEPIVVYGDFDVDGVAATVLMVQTLEQLGGNVDHHIPNRVTEGYGLRKEALAQLARDGARVVITVDCGVRAVEEVAYANELGMDVIITDHHSVGPALPDALAVVNPKRHDSTYPYSELAGVGVAFKLAQALLLDNQRDPFGDRPVRLDADDLLDLVALGTVADIVPLRDENRWLVKRGLQVINKMERPGIEALCDLTRSKRGKVDATAIGFTLGPRINAAGRLGKADIARRLLATSYRAEAQQLAEELDALNRERQLLTSEIEQKARDMAGPEIGDSALIFAAAPGLQPGIVGLAASRLSEEYYRPAVVVAIGEKTSRGSARSIPEFHITDALDACGEILIRHGGHAAAAGFTVANENLGKLEARLKDIAREEFAGRELASSLIVDVDVSLKDLTWELQRDLSRLEPYGCENPSPVFRSRNVRVSNSRTVGGDGLHLKMRLDDGTQDWDAIAFRQGEWDGKLPDRIDIVYSFEVNEWNGRRGLQLNVQDIKPTIPVSSSNCTSD